MRGREEGVLEEAEGWEERASQLRQVRQRQNPDKPSDLTSIRELLEEVEQDTHSGTMLFIIVQYPCITNTRLVLLPEGPVIPTA